MSAVEEGSTTAPPPPASGPPFPTDKEIASDQGREGDRFIQRLWDHVALQEDGIERRRLRQEILFATGAPWTWYCQVHPEARKLPANVTNVGKAEDEYFTVTIDNAVDHHWLVERDGKLYDGPVKLPEHLPLATVGGEQGAINFLLETDNDKALAELVKKTSIARRTRSAPMRAELKESIRQFGQANPIVKWQPRGQTKIITVDGATREEICEELGIEPWVVHIPPETPAATVLTFRIETERIPTTKSQEIEARQKYIETLEATGISREEIAKRVERTERRVNQVLKAQGKGRRMFKESDKVEVLTLHAAGRTPDQIAVATQWSKEKIYKTLVEAREAARPLATVIPLPTAGQKDPPPEAPKSQRKSSAGPPKRTGVQVDAIAKKYDYSIETIRRTGPKKVAAPLEAFPDVCKTILADYPDAFLALLHTALEDQAWVDRIRDLLP